jgi:hypothetical protein
VKILKGNHNQCQGCKEYFNSTGAFDKHRTGKHGVDRRCMTTEEMIAKGFSLNAAGYWIASKMPDHLKKRTIENADI